MNKRLVKILGVRVSLDSKEEILAELACVIRENRKALFAYINANSINMLKKNPWLIKFYNYADIVYADGQGVRLASWILGKGIPPHLPLTDWIWDILKYCQMNNYSIYILGGHQSVNKSAVGNLSLQFPGLNILGSHDGYFRKESIENDRVLDNINSLHPDILLVGFGTPIQESWIFNNYENINAHIILPAGGCIDILANKRRKVSKRIRQMGLEWAFRLVEEPNRLFTRYVIGNPKFILNIIKEYFRDNKN